MEPEVVPQTDLVPTLALLLGIPIPYSSVGQVMLPLFHRNSSQDAAEGLSQMEALWINAKQVRSQRAESGDKLKRKQSSGSGQESFYFFPIRIMIEHNM